MKLTIITLAVFSGCIALGMVYNYLLVNTNLLNRIRLPGHPRNPKLVRQHMPLIFLNIGILCVITPVSLYFAQNFFLIQVPSIGIFLIQFALFIFLDDLGFYIWHRRLHENRYLLQKVHAIHHRVRFPAPLEFIYVHPIEWVVGTTGILVAVLLIIAIYGQVNAYVFWSYITFRTLHELNIHSSTRTLIFKKIPFFGNVEYHDIHHLHARGNYASTFTYLDKIFGTGTYKLLNEK